MTAERNEISRRSFTATTTLTAAAVVAGGARRVLGANDRVVVAIVGIRGQGNALKQGFAKVPGVEIKTLCDVDENLFASRAHDPALASVPRFAPGYQKDMRRVFEDRDIDAVVVATPNHWHALASIWALQAGKHVFVEKPASHTLWEGRKMVEAAQRYGKVVQVGTMNRSRPGIRQAIEFLRKGGIGKLHTARGLCFKPRPAIGRYPDGPITDGRPHRLTVESAPVPDGVWDAAYLAKVDYDLWLGPAPVRPFNRNHFHYNWHWHWDYGNGDTGNQGPHQLDIARWGLGKNEHPRRVAATGGYFGAASSQETPDTHTSFFEYADGTILEFATRGGLTNDEGTRRIGNLFYGSLGWLWIDADGGKWQSYLGRGNEPGPGFKEDGAASSDPLVLTSQELLHYQNFVDAVRANDAKRLTSGIEEGHLSASLAHLANVSYQVRRQLEFDGAAERVVGDAEANALLTRRYRAPFEIPERV
jgi:predicted dehydrogenase